MQCKCGFPCQENISVCCVFCLNNLGHDKDCWSNKIKDKKIIMKNSMLKDLELEADEFICSDKLLYIVEKIKTNNSELFPLIEYIKTDFIKQNRDGLVYIHKWRNYNNYSINLNNTSIICSGHSDYEINENEIKILNSDKVKLWIGWNTNIVHPKLISFPLGITNWIREHPHMLIQGNTQHIYHVSKSPKNIKNLAYLNVRLETNPTIRVVCCNYFKNNSWVTNTKCIITNEGHLNYINEIYNHKFVICPQGNGIDTHRIWETLYLRSIPIVINCKAMNQFKDLPILFVNNWNEVTEEFLNEQYEIIHSKTYPLYKLKISYWYKFIMNKINDITK